MIHYVNGEYLSDAEAKISIFDRGFVIGDGVFDSTRTFGGTPFKLDAHLERLRRSMKYVELDGDTIVHEVRRGAEGALERSREEILEVGDVYVIMIVTRGMTPEMELLPDSITASARPTIVVMIRTVPFFSFGTLYDRGVDLGVSLLTRHLASPLDPRVKATSRLAYTRAERKSVRMSRAGESGYATKCWTVIFNDDGSISEAAAANLCILADGRLVRPPRHESLEGISLETVCDLACDMGLEVEERKLTLYDLINADETLITSTSFSVLPVVSIDGLPLPGGRDVYHGLLARWIELVDFDFVAQARERAEEFQHHALPA